MQQTNAHNERITKFALECGSDEHTWKDCTSTKKKCINCGDDHGTSANKCPKRKEAKESKRKERKNNVTNSQATKSNNSYPIQAPPTL
ncbi:hypothetical protein E2C01_062363 [Portunus trituberculatus]|uniref:CCHC-type domain-containing protein n=1 Tax=Portunus trituberculatus TaxID=210409 RepID=A0A5B7HDU6_PORTR|nr:hypothetical protein [Portunus trituberculatus]